MRLALTQGRYGKGVVADQLPTLDEFVERFLIYSQNNNKPSTVHAKQGLLRNHLVPAFGHMPLNEIGAAREG